MWALRTFAGPLLARIAGVPKGSPQTAADADVVTGILDTMFPVLPRAQGVIFDFFASFPDVNHYDLEAVTVPTLIVHAADDAAAPTTQPSRPRAASPAPAWPGWIEAATSCLGSSRPSSPKSPPSWRHQHRRKLAWRRLRSPAASDAVPQHGPAPAPPVILLLQQVALLADGNSFGPSAAAGPPPAGVKLSNARPWASVMARRPYPCR
jgi:hypothetical protein